MPSPRPADADAAAVLAEMAAVRGRIEAGAGRVAGAAGRSKDWTVYVRAAPLACAAGAAAAGYLLVPPRRSSRDGAKPKVVRVPAAERSKSGAPAAVAKPVSGRGPWMGVASVLGNVALRAGTAYLSQQAGKQFGRAAAEPAPEPAPQPAGPR